MGCGSSQPPPYSNEVVYQNRKQLAWALDILTRAPKDVFTWTIAYSIVCAGIACAHRRIPRSARYAYEEAGLIALNATTAKAELARGQILSIDMFVLPDNY